MYYYKKADKVISQLVNCGKKEFAIYPYGLRGKEVKEVLQYIYHIEPKYLIDSKTSGQDEQIIKFEEFLEKDNGDTIILLCSTDEKYYSEIRQNLNAHISKSRIVDVFSESAYFDKSMIKSTVFQKGCARSQALDVASRQIYYQNVEGNIAEVGVYRGDFSKEMSRYLPDRKLYLFDTFEGFDDRDILEEDKDMDGSFWGEGRFQNTSISIVEENIGKHVDMVIRKGYFPETAVGLEDERFAFVSLDTDLYHPTLTGLEFFWPRMSKGGFIFVHDYNIKTVEMAVNEFCRKNEIGFVHLPDVCHSVVIAKPL